MTFYLLVTEYVSPFSGYTDNQFIMKCYADQIERFNNSVEEKFHIPYGIYTYEAKNENSFLMNLYTSSNCFEITNSHKLRSVENWLTGKYFVINNEIEELMISEYYEYRTSLTNLIDGYVKIFRQFELIINYLDIGDEFKLKLIRLVTNIKVNLIPILMVDQYSNEELITELDVYSGSKLWDIIDIDHKATEYFNYLLARLGYYKTVELLPFI